MPDERDIYRQTLTGFLEPIGEYLQDASVAEVMINGPDQIYVERSGKLVLTDAKFSSENALLSAARNIAQFVGKRITPEEPRMDARLPDGSRVHVVLPPCARCGVVVSIRKFSKSSFSIDKLIEFGSVTEEGAQFIRACVLLHKNMVVSGGTSSGKTSLLNALSAVIPEGERIIVIEDSTELQFQQPHVVQLEARAADRHGKGQVTIWDLFHSAMRLRPDRIVVGEVRGAEALDMIQAMTSGHSGCMSTTHANSPRDALRRLETLAMMKGLDMPLRALRAQVSSAIDVIVQTERFMDGSRKISAVTEVLELSESGDYQTADIFRCDPAQKATDRAPELTYTGAKPTFESQILLNQLPGWPPKATARPAKKPAKRPVKKTAKKA